MQVALHLKLSYFFQLPSYFYFFHFMFFTFDFVPTYLPPPRSLPLSLSRRRRTRHSLSASSQLQRWLLQPLSTAQEVSEEDENSRKKKRRKCWTRARDRTFWSFSLCSWNQLRGGRKKQTRRQTEPGATRGRRDAEKNNPLELVGFCWKGKSRTRKEELGVCVLVKSGWR